MQHQTVRSLSGIELRKAVAKALGWKVRSGNGVFVSANPDGEDSFFHTTSSEDRVWDSLFSWEKIPHFESCIADAFPIAEKYRYAVIPYDDRWFAYPTDRFFGGETLEIMYDEPYSGSSPAEAICRCFLLREVLR